MNNTASTQRLFRGIALAAIFLLAPFAGCGKSSNPPAAAETAKTAPPAVETPAAAAPVATPAASSYTSTTTQPAAKPDPKQVFKAHDRDLYERAAKLQNDEKFAEAGKLYKEIVQLNTDFCGADHYRTRFARNRLRENEWLA